VGFFTILQNDLACPFEIESLGASAIVEAVDLTVAEDVVVICLRDTHKTVDLDSQSGVAITTTARLGMD
jgi:hypothetical protein